jgi:hypothetical protein
MVDDSWLMRDCVQTISHKPSTIVRSTGRSHGRSAIHFQAFGGEHVGQRG